MTQPKYKVVIRYKSGAEVAVRVDEITVSRNKYDGSLSISWENIKPKPLLMGVDDIESIWQET